MLILNTEKKARGRTCDSVPGMNAMEFEGCSEFAYQFSQLTKGIRCLCPVSLDPVSAIPLSVHHSRIYVQFKCAVGNTIEELP